MFNKNKKNQLKSYIRTSLNFMLKAVLFDMDGLVVDKEPFPQRSHVHKFDKFGIRLSQEQYNRFRSNQRWLYANNFAIIIT